MSYSEAIACAPPARPGCVVTSFTRSPPIQTSMSCSRRPFRYWRPVRAGMADLLRPDGQSATLPVGVEAGELVRNAADVGEQLATQAHRGIRRELQVDRVRRSAIALLDGASDLAVGAAGSEDADDII